MANENYERDLGMAHSIRSNIAYLTCKTHEVLALEARKLSRYHHNNISHPIPRSLYSEGMGTD